MKKRVKFKELIRLLLLTAFAASLSVFVNIPVSAAPFDITIVIPNGEQSVVIPLEIAEDRLYSGIQFALTLSDDAELRFDSFTQGISVSGAMAYPFSERNGVHHFGFYTAENIFQGALTVGEMNFTYTGNSVQIITITEIKIAHFSESGFTEWLRTEENVGIYRIMREYSDDDDNIYSGDDDSIYSSNDSDNSIHSSGDDNNNSETLYEDYDDAALENSAENASNDNITYDTNITVPPSTTAIWDGELENWVEFDENNTPLGVWLIDDNSGEWILNPYEPESISVTPPESDALSTAPYHTPPPQEQTAVVTAPSTGDTQTIFLFAISGITLFILGTAIKRRRKTL